jgi:pimeloyl-ACP methyl ester carboxylesterase
MNVLLIAVLLVFTGAGAWLYTPDKSLTDLERIYAQPPSSFRSVAGLRMHLRDTGPRDAPAIIMLHGLGSSLHTWDAWAQALQTHYRVIRYDLPGFGLTGPDQTGDYSDRRSAQVLSALMDSLGIAKATLIGNSMGGKLAWQYAAIHPSRVSKLVLISPDGFASPGFEYDKPAQVPFVARVLPYVLPRFMLRANLAQAYGDKSRLTEATVTRYYDLLRAPGVRQALLDRTAQVLLHPPEVQLRTIRCPTLLLWGEKDHLIPISNAQDYLRAIPNSRLVTFPDLGHVPMEEDPAKSLPPLEAFLAQTGASAGG